MTKKEFENLYRKKLNLKEKNWFLMPERSILSNNKVIISGYKEIDFDYLYFIVKDEVWEMDLQSNIRFVEQDFLLPQGLFKRCIAFAKDFSYGVDKVQFKNSGIKGQVIVILDHFAKKVVSILEEKPQTAEEFVKECLEIETAQIAKITSKEKSDATKWGENMISEKEIAEFDSFKTPSSDWVVPNGNAETVVPEKAFGGDTSNIVFPEEMFEKFKENYKLEEVEEGPVLAGKSSVLSSADFDFESGEYLKPGELNSKKKIREFEGGSLRDNDDSKPLVNHLDPYLRLRFGYQLKAGALKYGINNWKLGQPIETALESLHRHLAKYELNLKNEQPQDEDHLSAIIFNVQLIMMKEEKAGISVDEYFDKLK